VFEVARLIKSCRRFTSDEEKAKIDQLCDEAAAARRLAKELRPLLGHLHRHPPRRILRATSSWSSSSRSSG